MERELLRLSETPLHLEKTWESGGVPVLTAEVTLPCCGGKSRRARRFDRYYRQYARAYLKYCEAELLPRAAETWAAGVNQIVVFDIAAECRIVMYGLAHISAECYEIIIDISAELLCGV